MRGGPQLRTALSTTGGQTFNQRNRTRIAAGARLLLWPLVVLTLVACALNYDIWQKELTIAGPFVSATNPPRHSLLVAVPPEYTSVWWSKSLLPDDIDHPYRSGVELWINGRKMLPPHTAPETISEGTTAGFSHWGSYVIFSLPADVENTPEAKVKLRYKVPPPPWVTFGLAICSALLAWLSYHRTITSLVRRHGESIAALRYHGKPIKALVESFVKPLAIVTLRVPYWALLALCGVMLVGSGAFLVSALYALATGWALPTTALLRWSPIAHWAAINEPYLGYLLLMLAGFGAVTTWFAAASSDLGDVVRSDELRLRQILLWCGYPIAACALVLSISAMWSGIVRPSGDPHWANIGGLIPFTDGVNYYAGAYDQAKDGTWETVASHRPLAAALRSVLMFFGNYSLQAMLILQICLLAAAACFAAYAMAIWRGVWAGIAFFGFTYIYAHMFVPTTLTEPLGLFWAWLSIPFFIEAFRSGSAKPALVAFAMTSVALFTRMGSMFTIPALMLWLIWQFGEGRAAKFRIFVASTGVLLGIFGFSSLLQRAYGAGLSSADGNFAWVICGLTMGTTWAGCLGKLTSQGISVAETPALFTHLYALAWENFRTDPHVLFSRLADGASTFLANFWQLMWRGYFINIDEPHWVWRDALTALSVIGLLYLAVRRATRVELTFWMLLWASIILSAAFVYLEDGGRVMAASHPLIALFLGQGFTSPAVAATGEPGRNRLDRYGSAILWIAAILFLCVPWVAHRLSPLEAMVGDHLRPKQGEAFVFGGRRMSGFLVVGDDEPLRSDIPTLHLADFEAVIQQGAVENYQALLHPVMPPLPFGFIIAPRLERDIGSYYRFLVPAEVMERRNVPAWHFHFTAWQRRPTDLGGDQWFFVTKAEPWD
jgi:hypothetical protein